MIRELCKRDPVFFINHFCWTFDPRAEDGDKHRPFILYDFQDDEIKAADDHFFNRKDLLVEKSRDMGVSWLFAAWIFHKWLFEENFTALMGSRKADYVDNRQVDSLFGKFDYIMNHLPEWLQPEGFIWKDHRLSMKYINPRSGNTILGESTNTEFSRGGRFSLIFFDEFAFWEWADAAWRAAGQTTKCRIAVSTPNGANFFKDLRFSGTIDVRTIHWKLHPEKDDEWYAQEVARSMTPEDVAQELDISYDRSNRGRVYEDFESVPYGSFPYEPSWPLYVSWDYGLSDDTAIIWWQRDPMTGRRRIVDCYWNSGKLIDYYVPYVTGELASEGRYKYMPNELEIIDEHRLWKPAIHFGDPAGKMRSQAGGNRSVIDQLREHGIFTHTKDDANKFEIRRTKSRLVMRDLDVNDNVRTRYLRECMLNSRYPSERKGQTTSVALKPIHDWTSHLRSAFEYYAVNERTFRLRRPVDERSFTDRDRYSTIVY